jgi:hypothetical protein
MGNNYAGAGFRRKLKRQKKNAETQAASILRAEKAVTKKKKK